MVEESNYQGSEKSILNGYLNLGSLGAGAVHGFCDAQGIPLGENIEFLLTYLPATVRGGLGVLKGGLGGLLFGAALNVSEGLYTEEETKDIVKKGIKGGLIGTIAGSFIYGGKGVIVGGTQTLVGYGLGYVSGRLLKK